VAERPAVLIVDDDDSIRRLLAALLADEVDALILDAADGEAAVRAALAARPAVVLLDLMLPKMDGYAVAGHLRADLRTRGCYMIANSAGGDPTRALASGANEFLAKPFDLDAVVERVRDVVARAAADEPAASTDRPAAGAEGAADPPDRPPAPTRRPDRRREGAAPLIVGGICPICGRRVARLSDHLLGASPCVDTRPSSRRPARRGPPAQRGRFLSRQRFAARDLRPIR
jgi:CheY-like chemotaxis protein